MKKMCSKLFAMILIVTLTFNFGVIKVSAISQSDVQSKLQNLMNQYVGKTATSSQMYMGSQCKGFANWVFKEIFHVYIGPYPEFANYKITNANAVEVGVIEPGNLTEESAKKLLKKGAPGDFIQVQRSTARGRGPHSMILVSVKDDGIEVFDCNSDGKNTIKNYTISYHDFDVANRGMSLYHAYDYDYSSGPTSPPYNSSISLSRSSYGLNDTLEVTTSAEGGVDYNSIQIWEGSQLLVTKYFTGNHFSMPCSELGAGEYACYVVNVNSKGTSTSSTVNFKVAKKLTNAQISVEQTKLGTKDTLSVLASAEGGVDYYTIQIWRGSQLLHTESFTGHAYSIPCSQFGAGQYACYVACTNASGTIYTPVVNFSIGDINNQQIRIINDKLDINDTLEVLASAEGGVDYYTIQIWEGSELLHTESFTGHAYSMPCSCLGVGEYACYVACTNGAGTVLTSTVPFTIDEKIVNPKATINKNEFTVQETIDLNVSADKGAGWYTIEVFNQENEKVFLDKTSDGRYSLKGKTLGAGKYDLNITACNSVYSEPLQTLKINITSSGIQHNHSYITKTLKRASCTEKGIKVFTCSECGEEYDEEISMTAHSYTEKITKKASCNKEGEKLCICNICGNTKTEVIKATGHKWNEGEITKKPTCTRQGIKTYTCKYCKSTKTELIEKLPLPVKGTNLKLGKNVYKVAKKGSTLSLVKSTNTIIKVPQTIKIDGITYKVTSIADNAFKNNKKITKVILGKNITQIGNNAFSGCTKLKTVSLSANVIHIGDKAFYKCTALTEITIPSRVKKIGKEAFYGDKKLKSITIKTKNLSIKSVGKQAFKGINVKAKIKVPKMKKTVYKNLLNEKGVGKKVVIKGQ